MTNSIKTLTLTLQKKNRLYFAAINESGYKCKVKITPESTDLELGTHTLICEDLSVRSKYGTDLVYSVQADLKDTGIVTLRHFPYNKWLVESCHKLGGKWEPTEKAWVFSALVADLVEELEFIWNSEKIACEIDAKTDLYGSRDSVDFCGYPVASASGRDSGARLHDGIAQISGKITSSGSAKNWNTKIYEGSSFRLMIPEHFAVDNPDWFVHQLRENFEPTL